MQNFEISRFDMQNLKISISSVAIPETIARHMSAPDLFVSKVANVQSTPCPIPRIFFYPSGERTLETRLVLPLALAWFY